MNYFQETLSAGLTAGAVLLSGLAGQAHAQEALASGLAESLGLPMSPNKVHFWNAATQTTGALSCENGPRPDTVRCTLDASSAQAQMDYSYSYDIQGANVTATLDRVRSWDGVDYRSGTDYTTFYQGAVGTEWSAQNPLAENSPVGVVQNNVKKVEDLGQSVAITSVAPISDTLGLRISNIFDPVSNAVGAVVLPVFTDAALTAKAKPAIRHGFSEGDQSVFDANKALAARGGGTGFKASISQPPM